VSDRLIDVVDYEAQVMAAAIAVSGVFGSLICGSPLKQLDVQVWWHPQHRQLRGCARRHFEVDWHERRIGAAMRAAEFLRSGDLDKGAHCFAQSWNRVSSMI